MSVNDAYERVVKWMQYFKVEPSKEVASLYYSLVFEEFMEILKATDIGDQDQQNWERCDVVWVMLGHDYAAYQKLSDETIESVESIIAITDDFDRRFLAIEAANYTKVGTQEQMMMYALDTPGNHKVYELEPGIYAVMDLSIKGKIKKGPNYKKPTDPDLEMIVAYMDK